MTLSHLLSTCNGQSIPFPTFLGAEFLSVQASLVSNYSYSTPISQNPNHGSLDASNLSFCNVTLTHTHPGQDDIVNTNIWLPLQPEWNGRLQAVGGGGWVPGFYPLATDGSMSAAVAEGYVTVTTNGGVPSIDPYDWALLSPGNVDLLKLRNFASVALKDGVLAAKSTINSFYGKPANYSYWSGCSQGGRQGYIFAQQYPDIFDGIAAAAPALYWSQLFMANMFPKQVMYEMDSFPHPCELDTLTNMAIASCDADDGLVDSIISEPENCFFDPYGQIGRPTQNCTAPYAPATISKTAATVADAFWHGANGTNNESLWYTPGYSANMSASLAVTTCSANGTCTDGGLVLFPVWLTHFIAKDPSFDVTNLTREQYESAFKAGVREYDSLIGTSWTDLNEFKEAGGRLITYHGYADQLIPFNDSFEYYDAVTEKSPDIHDFYRLFGAPGLAHCSGGNGGYPAGTFDALVKWVEEGIAPDTLVAKSATNVTTKLCPYPKKAVFKGSAANYGFDDFVCE